MGAIKLATIKICPGHKVVYILLGVTNKDLHEAAGGDKILWMWLCSSCSSGNQMAQRKNPVWGYHNDDC